MEALIAKTAHRIPELLARAVAGDPAAAAQLAFLGILGTGTIISRLLKDHSE